MLVPPFHNSLVFTKSYPSNSYFRIGKKSGYGWEVVQPCSPSQRAWSRCSTRGSGELPVRTDGTFTTPQWYADVLGTNKHCLWVAVTWKSKSKYYYREIQTKKGLVTISSLNWSPVFSRNDNDRYWFCTCTSDLTANLQDHEGHYCINARSNVIMDVGSSQISAVIQEPRSVTSDI